jgi:glycosyltransferase involved in cell wall biosynthesis
MAKPVVASSVGGIPEIVEHGATGLLVAPRDVKGFADALIRLLQDRRVREEMGQVGVRKVRSQFNVEQVAHTLQGLYRSLVIGSPQPAGLAR